MKLDNFAISNHQTCPAKYKLRIIDGWTKRRRGGALIFGVAIHAGIADWYRSHDLESAITAIRSAWPPDSPVDDYRDLNKAIEVMREYVREYPREHFTVVGYPEVPMIEIPFALPLVTPDGEPVLTDGGEEIMYGGIFDGLVEASGQVFILEHKTTSQLGDYYFEQFKPNNQISGYVWAAQQLTGKRVGGAIVNAIGAYRVGKTKFKRQITGRSDTELVQWLRNVQAVASEIEWHTKRGYFPRREVNCTMYGACEYHSVHVLQHEHEELKRLETDYVIDPWDFERREGNAV